MHICVCISVWVCACVLREFPFLVFSCVSLCKNVIFAGAHVPTYIHTHIRTLGGICSGHTPASSVLANHLSAICVHIWRHSSATPLTHRFSFLSRYSLLLLLPYLSHIALPLENASHITAHSTRRFLYSIFSLLTGLTLNLRNNFYSFPSLSAILDVSHSNATMNS